MQARPLDGSEALPEGSSVSARAGRLQRRVATAVLVVPSIATAAALVLGAVHGFAAWQLGLLAAAYGVTMFGITAGFHRHFAHRAFRTSPAVRVALGILGSMAAQGPLLFWVTAHRRHHAYSDGPGDPHSPNLFGEGFRARLKGFWHAHMGWMLVEDVSNWSQFTRDLIQDRRLLTLHQLYPLWVFIGLAVPACIGAAVTRSAIGAVEGMLWGGFVRMFLVNQAAWCVGSVCHLFGKRPFPTPDSSGNVKWVAWITFGEGMQNNHHAFPSSAMHGLRFGEPDISGWLIRLLEKLGCVWDVKAPSLAVQAAARTRGYRGLDPKLQGIVGGRDPLEGDVHV